jgi:hypothetical protein
VGSIPFISKPHDDDAALILAPYSLHSALRRRTICIPGAGLARDS